MAEILDIKQERKKAVRRACSLVAGYWRVVHRAADGRVLDEEFGHNLFHDEGEELLAKQYTGELTWPTTFYVGADDRSGNSYSITGVTSGDEGSFVVSGDVTAECTAGEPLRVTGSTGNDGVYTILSASYDSTNDETTITVEGNVPDGTADGTLTLFLVTEADTLADLVGEPGGTNGYSRQAADTGTTDWSASQVSGDWQAKTATLTITASGGSIGPLNTVFLCTSSDNTGRLLQTLAMATEKTLADGEGLDLTTYVRFSE